MRYFCLVLLLMFAISPVASAGQRSRRPGSEQQPPAPAASTPTAQAASPAKPDEKPKEPPEEPPVVTHHKIHVGGNVLKYTATVGLMPIRNSESGDTEAHIFFMAYTLDDPTDSKHRPLMFSFNGGPGSASVWLHLGAIGPRRVKMSPEGKMPAPPFELEDNQSTWLDQTDLVFIDPVGTGYSRPVKPELGTKFWSLQGDIDSVGEFIRMYLTRYERWTSPLFIVGESYGTTRASGLSGYLIDKGIALDGIVLVSSVLNFETLEFARGNDLPYVLYLPSFTTTAWYYKKLPPDLQADFAKAIAESEQFASGEYSQALAKGDQLTPAERRSAIGRYARLTGLSETYIDNANLRVAQWDFCKELLRDQKRSVGRLDSRFEGIDASNISEAPDYDPSEAAIRPPYTATFNNYVRAELGYKTDLVYYILGGGVKGWEFPRGEYADVSPALRNALTKNPFMRVFVAEGYYDLATPFYGADYTIAHLGLDPTLRNHVSTAQYEAGHMMYIRSESLAKLKHDVSAFLEDALK